MKTVLISAPYLIPFMDRFQHIFDENGLAVIIAEVEERLEADDLLQYAGKIDGAICGDDRFTRNVIERMAPRLRTVCKWGTGIDSIDQEACRDHGVSITRTPNAFSEPVADSVLGYALNFLRRQSEMDREMKAGNWTKIPGRAMNDITFGIIGTGDVGKAVARRVKAFGAKLLGCDIREMPPDFIDETGIRMVGHDELLGACHVVSINCDLNPTSFHLMNDRTFGLMRKDAVLINAARGPVVEEAALLRALENKTIAGVALDVFEFEPVAKDNPLLGMDNVFLAPHNSNSSPKAWDNVHLNTINNLLREIGD